MMELNDNQIAHIEQVLREHGLTNDALRDELLDHVCCQVEVEMGSGLRFGQALEHSLNAFEEDEMEDIQACSLAIFHKKNSIMKKVSIAALITMLVVCSAYWLRDEETAEIAPPLDVPTFLQALQDPPDISPLGGEFKVTSSFGMRMHPIHKVKKMHSGVDFIASKGTSVFATSDGIVAKAEYHQGYGNHIVIQHDEQFQTLYAHLSQMDVELGQEVKKGTVIGAVGSTGESTGPCLHYEVIKDGEYQDPEEYLRP